METAIVYFILISSFVFTMGQIFVSMNYFKRFAFEYLSNEPISWNPNHDRSALAFSVFFGLFSIFIMREIWQGNTDNSWFLTFLYWMLITMLTVFTILFLRHIIGERKKDLANLKKNEQSKYVDDLENLLPKFKKCLSSHTIIAKNTEDVQFVQLTKNIKKKDKIICTAKYNNSLNYRPLIIFYRVILKDEYFTLENVEREIKNNFLFEKRDLRTGESYVGELDHESFKNAFEDIDFKNLKKYQQKSYDELRQILN